VSTSRWASIIIGTKADNIIKEVTTNEIETRYDNRTGKPYDHPVPITRIYINGHDYTGECLNDLLADHDLELINASYDDGRYIGSTLTSTDDEMEIDHRTDFTLIRDHIIEHLKMLQPNLDVSQVKMYLVFHEA
jgi:hypothetical protein